MKISFRKTAICIVLTCFVFGCATPPEQVQSTYVSPFQYNNLTCNQIRMEIQRVDRKTREIAQAQRKESNKDAVAMGVGMLLFWPALFMLIGKDKSNELARLKGEFDALEQAAIQKECNITLELKEVGLRREKEEAERKKKSKEFDEGLKSPND